MHLVFIRHRRHSRRGTHLDFGFRRSLDDVRFCHYPFLSYQMSQQVLKIANCYERRFFLGKFVYILAKQCRSHIKLTNFFYIKFQASYKIYSQLLESCLRIYDLIKIVKLLEGVNIVIYSSGSTYYRKL